MLRLTKLSNKFRRRTLRPFYAHTQAYPYAAQLDPAFDRNLGQLAGANAVAGSKAAILPGSVMTKLAGEVVTLSGATDTERAFGLAANFVGGELDELGDNTEVGVWRGVGSVWQILAPAFDATGISAAAAAEDGTDEKEVYLRSGADGRLKLVTPGNPGQAFGNTARLIQSLSANTIVVELLV